ncbi:hypothetical protein [Nocardioides nanhaiensis]|uniref:Uncharacterized protein n=1 Tax=Nocardioides nanhaiensis TaxID=1476871 RepID=A0ABP8X324_9ACTN
MTTTTPHRGVLATALLLTTLASLLVLAFSTPPAHAAQRTWADPRGDHENAPGGMDILAVSAKNGERRFAWTVRLAHLERSEGTGAVRVLQKMANSEGYVFDATSRWRDGEPRTALFLQYGTLPEQRIRVRCAGLDSTWNTRTDSVRIIVPTACRSVGVRTWRELVATTLLPGGGVDDVTARRAPLRNG